MTNLQDSAEKAVEASAWAGGEARPGRRGGAACEAAWGGLPKRRLDPRVSLFLLVLLNLIAFAPKALWVEAAALAVCASLMCWCGRSRAMLRWLAAYAALLALGLAAARIPNEATASFAMMLVVSRRVLCLGMFASNMIATTRVGEMAAAFQRMRLPRGAVVGICVALRFFPTMGKEFVSVSEAMRLRGVPLSLASALRRPGAVVENLMVPVMSRLAVVAEELSNAAIARGIDSDAPRTSYYELRLAAPDFVFTGLFLALVGCVALVRLGAIS